MLYIAQPNLPGGEVRQSPQGAHISGTPTQNLPHDDHNVASLQMYIKYIKGLFWCFPQINLCYKEMF